jgi:hypothetical protein
MKIKKRYRVGDKFTLANGVEVTLGQDIDLDKTVMLDANGERITEKRAQEIAEESMKRYSEQLKAQTEMKS